MGTNNDNTTNKKNHDDDHHRGCDNNNNNNQRGFMSSRSSSNGSVVASSSYLTVAYNLTETRGLTYHKAAAVVNNKPRHVAHVWRDFRSLFQENVSDSTKMKSKHEDHPSATEEEDRVIEEEPFPKELMPLANVMKTEHATDSDLNKELFRALRKCLERQGLIENCNDATMPEEEYIVFCHGKTERDIQSSSSHAIGIAREASSGEHNQRDHHEPRARSATHNTILEKNTTTSGFCSPTTQRWIIAPVCLNKTRTDYGN
jgi:hypothetical protein